MLFDRSKLSVKPLKDRIHDLDAGVFMSLERVEPEIPSIREVARRIAAARGRGSAVIMMMGGHVIRSGAQRYIIDMIENSLVTCVSTNGAGIIHDYEFSLIGATTESVSKYICEGQFGLWQETAGINDIVNEAYGEGGVGMGTAVGRAIEKSAMPYRETSISAACYRAGVPLTVHVGIGYDIIHEHGNFDGAAAGATSYLDFLLFASEVSNLEGGVVMNFGSAVMAPEVFLKALSMARNVAHGEGRRIKDFATLVCDLHDLPPSFRTEPPPESPAYYFRPWKTMLVRTVAEGGESFYVRGRHSETLPQLWTALKDETAGKRA